MHADTPRHLALRPIDVSRIEKRLWSAVLSRDASNDGQFVYAVRSTGVYCRPSCPSRRPHRAGVTFFTTPDAAEVAGFRACRRCKPREGQRPTPGIDRVLAATHYIAAHVDESITLQHLGRVVGTSPFHLQRLFVRVLGVSPRAYHRALRAERFRRALRRGIPVAQALYGAGYGSTSRVYERRPTGPGLTPAAYRRGGRGVVISFTIVASALGRLLVAGTEAGVCSVKLGDRDAVLEADLRREYPSATIRRAGTAVASWVRALVAHLEGRSPVLDLPIDVQATAFQWRVWKYLQSIPYGETRTYSEVAAALGAPAATRAVARACASNRVCLVVPCHRVVQKDGGLGGYRWGVERKRRLLAQERPPGRP